MRAGAATRVHALVTKDVAELTRTPGAILPPLAIGLASLVPPFLIALIAPALSGEALEDSEEFTRGAELALRLIPEMRGLEGAALLQSFVFHQSMIFLLMVPVVGAMALAAHAVISEKLARTLEPLLATPLGTGELLVAKTLAPLAVAMLATGLTLGAFAAGIFVFAEPGVLRSLIGARTALLFVVVGPLLALAALLLAVIMSSRVNDARTAQQLSALVILPIVAVFIGQVTGQFILGSRALLVSVMTLTLVDLALVWVGVRVFDRETILMRWK